MAKRTTDTTLLELAHAILAERDLEARQLSVDLHHTTTRFADLSLPETSSHEVLVLAAALAELFALRREEPSPAWVQQIGGLDQPRYLLGDPRRYPRFYARCVAEAPWPLKRRNLIAPNDYLTFA